MANRNSEKEWRCELQPSDAEQAGVLFVDIDGIQDMDLDTEAVSGLTTLLAEGAIIANATIKIPKGAKKTISKIERRGSSMANNKRNEKTNNPQTNANRPRNLSPLELDVRRVLGVRVVASDATTTANLTTLGGNIFGTGATGSLVNMVERYTSCSYGLISMTPYNGQVPSSVNIKDGMVEVSIGITVTGIARNTVADAVIAALRTSLGISDLPSVFDHVMLCLPPGTAGDWIGYGKREGRS